MPRISAQARVDVALEDRHLVVAVPRQALDLLALDLERALVLLHAVAVEHAHLDHGAEIAGLDAQRGVAHVRGLLAEDRAQQLLLRRHRAFALGGDLAHEDVAGLHIGPDIDDPRLVEVAQRLLAHVGDVAGDLLGPELGVAGGDLELLDMHAREHVVLDDPLGDQDRVLVVVAVPRHEGDDHVLAQRQLAHVGAGAVGDHLALLDHVAHLDQRTLVDAAVLVRALELAQPVDVDAGIADLEILGGAHHDALRIDLVDGARAARHDRGPGILGHLAFDAGAHQRRLERSVGTAWRCMFEPISARLASSFSRNGISEAATETSCLGLTSIRSTLSTARACIRPTAAC